MRSGPLIVTLACLCAGLALLSGCGGSGSDSGGGGGRGPEDAVNVPAPPSSAFPAPAGRTLRELLTSADEATELKIEPAATVFYDGVNRYPFGVFQKAKGGGRGREVDDAEVAIYYAKVPSPTGKKSKTGVKGAAAKATGEALDQPAFGPFPAKIETLATKPKFEAETTADDPEAASVVYSAEVPLPSDGQWRLAALIKEGGKITSTLLPSAIAGEFDAVPRVGERPPAINTPTAKDVDGDLSKITTRVPPDTMNEVDFTEALGKEPILLLFATPQFCQSRVCGPVVDVAEEAKAKYGDRAQFIHMEIYNDNDPSKFTRPQVRAFHLPTEPWLFAIDREGVVTAAVEGAFGAELLDETVEKAVAK